MQVKAPDDRRADLDALDALARDPSIDPLRRAEIDALILEITAASRAHLDAVEAIEAAFGGSEDVLSIHDLRVEVDGVAASFDHLILNRLGEVRACDSRAFREGLAVTETGDWTCWRNGRRDRIPSPVARLLADLDVLGRVFDDGLIALPRRFGRAPFRPELRAIVLVARDARVGRPNRRFEGLDHVVRVDELARIVGPVGDASPIRLTRLMTRDDLGALAWDLVALHRPRTTDWARRFGVIREVPDGHQAEEDREPAPPPRTLAAPAVHLRSGHHCASCGGPVTWGALRSSWNQPARFGRNVYCSACQLRFAPA